MTQPQLFTTPDQPVSGAEVERTLRAVMRPYTHHLSTENLAAIHPITKPRGYDHAEVLATFPEWRHRYDALKAVCRPMSQEYRYTVTATVGPHVTTVHQSRDRVAALLVLEDLTAVDHGVRIHLTQECVR